MPVLLASEVMDSAAAVLNDANRTVYDYATQLPYLRLALQELQETFELNSLPVTEFSSAAIPVKAGVVELEFNAVGSMRLPDNLIEIQGISEWTNSFWSPIPRANYVWKGSKLYLTEYNLDREIKIDYIGSLFPKFLRSDTILPVQNAFGYLSYKTAELISDQIEHNMERAQTNGGRALASLDRINGITVKTKQNVMARRRPFRAAYRRTSGM